MLSNFQITYKERDGWHVFSCADLGMYVASKDFNAALNDIAPSVRALMTLNGAFTVDDDLIEYVPEQASPQAQKAMFEMMEFHKRLKPTDKLKQGIAALKELKP